MYPYLFGQIGEELEFSRFFFLHFFGWGVKRCVIMAHTFLSFFFFWRRPRFEPRVLLAIYLCVFVFLFLCTIIFYLYKILFVVFVVHAIFQKEILYESVSEAKSTLNKIVLKRYFLCVGEKPL